MIWGDVYLALAALCAVFVYVSWRKRLGIHDPLGAVELGMVWPIMLPIIVCFHLSKKSLW